MFTKPITSVAANIYRTFLSEKDLPVISEKWSRNSREIVIELQQYNVPVNINPENSAFLATSHTTGMDIQLVCQTLNIPDLNVLDLELFNPIKSL